MRKFAESHLVWLGIVPDYTLPAARELLTDQHATEHLSIGVSGYKIDEVDGYDHWLWQDHAVFPSGTSAETMRQTYGLLMQRKIHEDLFRKRNVRTMGQVRASNGGASRLPFALYSDSFADEHGAYRLRQLAVRPQGGQWVAEETITHDEAPPFFGKARNVLHRESP